MEMRLWQHRLIFPHLQYRHPRSMNVRITTHHKRFPKICMLVVQHSPRTKRYPRYQECLRLNRALVRTKMSVHWPTTAFTRILKTKMMAITSRKPFLLIFCRILAILAPFAWTSLRTMMTSGDLHADMLSMPRVLTRG